MLNIEGKIDKNTMNLLNKVFFCALDVLSQPNFLSVNLYFVDKTTIKNLNKKFRKVDSVTDVLSFPYLDIAAGEIVTAEKYKLDMDMTSNDICLGEIFICDSVAQAQAKEYGHSSGRERAFLFCHGLLHLFGYDHMKQEEDKILQDLQDKILNICDIKR